MQEAEVVREKRSIIRCDNYKVDTAVGYPGKKKCLVLGSIDLKTGRESRGKDWRVISI